jgi:hypothetical protein
MKYEVYYTDIAVKVYENIFLNSMLLYDFIEVFILAGIAADIADAGEYVSELRRRQWRGMGHG